jgi:hypothetical protein
LNLSLAQRHICLSMLRVLNKFGFNPAILINTLTLPQILFGLSLAIVER